MIRRLPAFVPILLAAGCAGGDGAYPSLAPRAIEARGFAEPAAAPVVVVADPALDRRIAELDTRLRELTRSFTEAASAAERKAGAARGRPAGSEPWLDAQTALAGLDDFRARASALATDVEESAIARAATLAPPYPALADLADRAEAEGARQGKTIARVQATLAPA